MFNYTCFFHVTVCYVSVLECSINKFIDLNLNLAWQVLTCCKDWISWATFKLSSSLQKSNVIRIIFFALFLNNKTVLVVPKHKQTVMFIQIWFKFNKNRLLNDDGDKGFYTKNIYYLSSSYHLILKHICSLYHGNSSS